MFGLSAITKAVRLSLFFLIVSLIIPVFLQAAEKASGSLSVGQEIRKSEDQVAQPRSLAPRKKKEFTVSEAPVQKVVVPSTLSAGSSYNVDEINIKGDAMWLETLGVLPVLEAGLIGKSLSGEKIKAVVAVGLEMLFQRGYYLAVMRITGCSGGILSIECDMGHVGSIAFFQGVKQDGSDKRVKGDIYTKHFFSDAQLRKKLLEKGIYENSVFDYKGLYNAIYAANTHPDLTMDVDLKVRTIEDGGMTRRYIDMDFIVEDNLPLHAFLSVANSGTDQTGEWRPSVTAQYLNLTKHDDILTAYVGPFSTDAGKLKGGSVSYYIPYEYANGGSVTVYTGYADLNVDDAVPGIDIRGEGWYAGGQVAYKLFRNLKHEVQVSVGLVWRKVKNRLVLTDDGSDEEVDNRDYSLAPIILGVNYASASPDRFGGRNFISSQTSINTAGAIGASDEEDIKRLWEDADADYVIERLNVSRLQPVFNSKDPIKGPWLLFLKIGAQLASGSLVPAEQLAIGGMSTVRGFPDSIVLGDDGVTGRAELRTPLWAGKMFQSKAVRENAIKKGKPLDRVQLIAFLDGAYVSIKEASEGEEDSYSMASIGVGVRVSVNANFQMSLDYGFPLTDTDDLEVFDDDVDKNGRFHLRAQLGF